MREERRGGEREPRARLMELTRLGERKRRENASPLALLTSSGKVCGPSVLGDRVKTGRSDWKEKQKNWEGKGLLFLCQLW